mgnify:CR=1 FL=1
MDILNRKVPDMAGIDFECTCGKRHSVGIKQILCGSGVKSGLADVVKTLGGKHVFMLADNNTYRVLGEYAGNLMKNSGLCVHTKIFCGETPLVPNESVLGSALAEMEPEDDIIVAVGSGSLNDTARMLSARLRIPYVIAATAPSMDGYASTVSPLILDGQKITKAAVYPAAIVADTSIMKDAPYEMLTAGYGDIIGKFTALADWRLSRELNGEYYCPQSVALMEKAVHKCVENGTRLQKRDEEAVGYVTEALILSGVAMGLVGNSRPASGAEHHFSHYWEVEYLKKGMEHPLHGNSVGVAAVISSALYELARPFLPAGFIAPDSEAIRRALDGAGACADPKSLGISRDLFIESVIHAMEIRERFTILRLCDNFGKLPEFADILAERYYN